MVLMGLSTSAYAKTILYVPQDDRPVDYAYTVKTAEDAGYTVLTPPRQYLSGSNFHGSPDELMNWVETHASEADAMVLSVDSLVYGGLVDSRKHNLDMNTIMNRLKNVESLHSKYGHTPIYVFSTVMRSPWAGGKGVEPDYYLQTGNDIYQLAALQNKADTGTLTPEERSDWFAIMSRVPLEYLQDWYNRRKKNMAVNYRLIDDAKNGVFTYFSLGHDDNSAHTQSALEAKYLEMRGKDVPKTAFGSFPGADQLGLLLITRANNDFNNYHPKVTIIYPLGGGEKTVPSYDGQAIGKTIAEHIEAIGGTVTDSEKPDLLLAVNTPLTTSTTESNSFENFPIMLDSTKEFLGHIESAVKADIPVSIVDMAFSNGADNTLVYGLYQDKMMYKVAAYNGWNTASNSVGYGLSQGILSRYMSESAHKDMLTTNYLDNWAYQANVRNYLYRMQKSMEAGRLRRYYPTEMGELQGLAKLELQRYAQTYLEVDPKTIEVTLPWNRLFEVYVDVHKQPNVQLESDIRNRKDQEILENLLAQVKASEKAYENAKIESKGKLDAIMDARLKQAVDEAKGKYDTEVKTQEANRNNQSLAARNRTWAPSN
ncbi:MAG: DUF4127 family protein [Anaeroglobus sp.]|nr:DUF4127 family protein [Anaeroglobus sp.]